MASLNWWVYGVTWWLMKCWHSNVGLKSYRKSIFLKALPEEIVNIVKRCSAVWISTIEIVRLSSFSIIYTSLFLHRAHQYNIIQIWRKCFGNAHVHKTCNVHWECLSKQWMKDSEAVVGGGNELHSRSKGGKEKKDWCGMPSQCCCSSN